jgi:hypothetical protein
MKELGEAVWRAADKAEPVKNQDCRDYTMTMAAVSATHVAWYGGNAERRVKIAGKLFYVECCIRMSRAFDVFAKSMYNWRFSRFESRFS